MPESEDAYGVQRTDNQYETLKLHRGELFKEEDVELIVYNMCQWFGCQ